MKFDSTLMTQPLEVEFGAMNNLILLNKYDRVSLLFMWNLVSRICLVSLIHPLKQLLTSYNLPLIALPQSEGAHPLGGALHHRSLSSTLWQRPRYILDMLQHSVPRSVSQSLDITVIQTKMRRGEL